MSFSGNTHIHRDLKKHFSSSFLQCELSLGMFAPSVLPWLKATVLLYSNKDVQYGTLAPRRAS